MALHAGRILSTLAASRWNRMTSSAFRLQSLFTSSRNSRSDEQAFWDIEGSVVVDPTKYSSDLKHPVISTQKVSYKTKEDSEILRITSFGHIRLDQDNPALEPKDVHIAKEPDSLNFIDNQFFGDKLSTQATPHLTKENSKFQASGVPVDTNPVDQQYFYPSSGETEKTSKHLQAIVAPSASELEFEENEVDDQYFGKKSTSGVPITSPGKVSAYSYLKSLQGKRAESLDIKTGESAESEDKSTKQIYEEMIPSLYKMPNEDIVFLLKKSVIYNKGNSILQFRVQTKLTFSRSPYRWDCCYR